MPNLASRPIPHIKSSLWNATPQEFQGELEAYFDDFPEFNPDHFLEIKFHLLKGNPTYDHKQNLCQVVDAQNKCGRCIYKNTDDCTLSVEVVDKSASMAERLLDMVLRDVELFTSNDRPFARMRIKNHTEVHAVESKTFARYLSHLLYKTEGKPPSAEALRNATNVLAAKAHFEGESHKLSNRVAEYDGAFYYDLTNRNHEVIKITPDGWELLEETDIPLFRRYRHQEPAPYPAQADEETPEALRQLAARILKYVNHDESDPHARLLILVVIISYLIPGIPHPVAVVFGDQGSAKSSFFRIIKRLVDPSMVELMAFPSTIDNLIQALDHQWFIGFDNVGDLKDYISDFLCRAVTGEGYLKRELYSDDEDVIYTYQRCIGLNGINNAATKPDLLDRSVLFTLPRIPTRHRRAESEIWAEFEADQADILGAMFSIIAKAMAEYDRVQLNGLFRLADWTIWGCAISQAMGLSAADFLEAYGNNRMIQTDEALSNDNIATLIMQLIEIEGAWSGTMTDLLSRLAALAEQESISTTYDWPKAPHSLSRHLNVIRTTLREAGIQVGKNRDKTGKRIVTILYQADENRVSLVSAGQRTLDGYPTKEIQSDNESVKKGCQKQAPDGLSGHSDAFDAFDAFDAISRTSTGGIPKDPEWWYREVQNRMAEVGAAMLTDHIMHRVCTDEEIERLTLCLHKWESEGRVIWLMDKKAWKFMEGDAI